MSPSVDQLHAAEVLRRLHPEALVDAGVRALRARRPSGISEKDVSGFLARMRADLVATARAALPRVPGFGPPVPIPWNAGTLPGPTGVPVLAFDRAKADAAGVRWARDREDLQPGFQPPEHFDVYDVLAIQMSGGKDSVACLLALRRLLRPRPDLWSRVELWHQDVDGGAEPFMDWPVTRPYIEALGALFGLRVRFAYREGGFWQELHRKAGVSRARKILETDSGPLPIGKPPLIHNWSRERFPALTSDLKTRWCSSELKIDVGRTLAGYVAATGARNILLISGERAAESAPRAKYHRGKESGGSSGRRQIHQLRLVYDHTDAEVWDELRLAFADDHPDPRFGLQAHPAYELGWGRCSCAGCIFSSGEDLARLRLALPAQFERLASAEEELIAKAEQGQPWLVEERERLQARLDGLDRRKVNHEERAALRLRLDAIGKDLGRAIVKGKTVRQRADAALVTLPEDFEAWRAFADGTRPWTVQHLLRGPKAPVFAMPWELPPGATNPDSSGPPT